MTAGSTIWPSATIAEWDKFIASAAATDPVKQALATSSGERHLVSYFYLALVSALASAMIMLA